MRLLWCVLVLLAASMMWAWTTGRVARLTLAFQILDELRRPTPESWLRRATPAPGRSAIALAGERFRLAADLYRPARDAGEPLSPLYPDVLRCARLLRRHADHLWPAARLARAARIPRARAEAALEALAHAAFVERESYALNFSGEPHYRFGGAGVTGRPRVRPRAPSPSRR